ncbi:MAG: hypothetical protein RJA44_474 [Pseudomonadota bacterium]
MSCSRPWKVAACYALPLALWSVLPARAAENPAVAVAPAAASAPAAAASAVIEPASAEFLALQRRAEAGEAVAQFELAKALELGRGSGQARDFKLALPWYLKAAEQNHAEAQSRLGAHYQTTKQDAEALRWLERAAALGHARATNNLASMYDFGQGVPQDGPRAIHYYTRAAELGWPEAMWNLANIYGAGRYGAADMELACVWALRARKYAEPDYRAVLNQVNKKMALIERSLGSERMASCRERAEAWQPQPPRTTAP